MCVIGDTFRDPEGAGEAGRNSRAGIRMAEKGESRRLRAGDLAGAEPQTGTLERIVE
jgi:hypothetical protein